MGRRSGNHIADVYQKIAAKAAGFVAEVVSTN
jgi:hypothetical protein